MIVKFGGVCNSTSANIFIQLMGNFEAHTHFRNERVTVFVSRARLLIGTSWYDFHLLNILT